MPTWLFVLIVIGFGVALAMLFDHLKIRSRGGTAELPSRRERAKWLYYWYLGRFPTREEQAADDQQAEAAALASREELARKDEERRRRK